MSLKACSMELKSRITVHNTIRKPTIPSLETLVLWTKPSMVSMASLTWETGAPSVAPPASPKVESRNGLIVCSSSVS